MTKEEWSILKEKILDYHHHGVSEDFISFQIAGEHNGKDKLRIRKASSAISKEGIVISPLYAAGDVVMDEAMLYLYFPFNLESTEYWGEKKSKNYPGVVYPYYRIIGMEV